MLIPLGTELSLRRTPVATFTLISITTLFSAGLWAMGLRAINGEESIYDGVRFVWNAREWWRVFTYQFAHADILHLLGNIIFLWVFGPALEEKLGHAGFTILYLLGGAAAVLLNALVTDSAVIGASGSIAVIAGAFVVLFPLIEIRVMLLLFFRTFSISARWFLVFCVLKDIFFHGAQTAWMVHLAGYGIGFVIGCLLLVTKLVPRDQFDVLALMNRMRRRMAFRAAATAGEMSADQRMFKSFTGPFRKNVPDPAIEMNEKAAVLRASLAEDCRNADWKAAGIKYNELLGLSGLSAAVRALQRDRQMELCGGLMKAGQYREAHAAFSAFVAAYPKDRDAFAAQAMGAMVQFRHLGETAAALASLQELRKTVSDDEHIAMIDGLLAEAESAKA